MVALIPIVMNLGFMIGLKGNWNDLRKLDWKRWKEVRKEHNREGKKERD